MDGVMLAYAAASAPGVPAAVGERIEPERLLSPAAQRERLVEAPGRDDPLDRLNPHKNRFRRGR
jgi:hypothetical protein